MKQFNRMKPSPAEIVDEVTKEIYFKWNNHKNYLLENKEHVNILYKVMLKNEQTSLELYTKFIYRTFLERFNPFFTIKTPVFRTFIKGKSIYAIYFSTTLAEVMKENLEAIHKNEKNHFMAFTTHFTPMVTNNTYFSYPISSQNLKSCSTLQMCTWLMSWKPV